MTTTAAPAARATTFTKSKRHTSLIILKHYFNNINHSFNNTKTVF